MEVATRRREQEVWQACDDLWALHGDLKTLTGDAIRDHLLSLGKSRGSPNEIYKYKKSWLNSRKPSQNGGTGYDEDENDPITRAVRLVHEKLQFDTSEQIEALKVQYEQKLQEKEQEKEGVREDLTKVIDEYSKLQHDHTRIAKELSEKKIELEAEIAIRIATDNELSSERKKNQLLTQSYDQSLKELKAAHESHLASLKQLYEEEQVSFNRRLQLLEQEKKELGHEFSENLNELRLKEYNLLITNEKLKEKVNEQNDRELKQFSLIKEQGVKLKRNLEHVEKLIEQGHNDKVKNELEQALNDERTRHQKTRLILKKHEINVARLRMMLKLR